ncbi:MULTISPECIES: hypothetical protein [Patulibacter]|jgi:hypothetical protein|uniref:Unannotated protein n=1 Tax=freshwater metagenome TaxID=449393 RepID=A0A6J7FTW0_9ZZZZ|nr:hypothetical protein [Patulibacter minatonensis]MSW49589.1 hypothetical protein [Actinomycetota bacterium]
MLSIPGSPRPLLMAVLSAGALASCGAESSDPAGPASTTAPTSVAGSPGSSCPDIPVPGHRATRVRVVGVTCAVAVTVANDAEGRGRAAYASAGLSCTPSDATAGDTDYACTDGERRLTFRYGAR